MARIEHRRVVRPLTRGRVTRDDDDPAGDPADDELDVDGAAAARRGPLATLDNLTWLGWASGGIAIGWLIIQLRPLFHAGAFAEPERLDDVVAVVRAVSSAAALALPAALERGAAKAWQRAPWLYRAAVFLALSQVATIVLDQLRERFLADVDLGDPTQPIVLVFAFASLAPAIATIGGMWALSDGLWDLGARPSRLLLRLVGGAALLITLLTYIPFLNQAISAEALLVSALNVLRIAVSLGVIAITAVAGTHLVAGAFGRRAPRVAWILAGIAGAAYLLGTFARAATGVPLPQDVLVPLFYAVFVLNAAAPVVLLLSFIAGLARSASIPVPARRLVARWVRYPAA